GLGFLGLAAPALGFRRRRLARLLGAPHRVLLLLYAALLDLPQLAQREQHGILTFLRLCHGTSFVGQAYTRASIFITRDLVGQRAQLCPRPYYATHSSPHELRRSP